MTWSNALATAWMAVAGIFAILIAVLFLSGYQLRRLLTRYGSVVDPGIVDSAGLMTPAAQIQIQKYVLSKAYCGETRKELRVAGQRQRRIFITGLVIAALYFALTALIIVLSV